MYFVFRKMGKQGWEGLIPVYNMYVLFDELYGNGLKFLLLLIPVYNIYVLIKLYIDWAKAFGQSGAFVVGLILLQPVFLLILGLNDNYQYCKTTDAAAAPEAPETKDPE